MPYNKARQEGESGWEFEIREKVDMILSNQAAMGADLKTVTELVYRIRSTVYGNGQEGLVTKVAVLMERLFTHTQVGADEEDNGDGKKKMPDWVEKMIMPVVVAGVLWFLFSVLPQLVGLLAVATAGKP